MEKSVYPSGMSRAEIRKAAQFGRMPTHQEYQLEAMRQAAQNALDQYRKDMAERAARAMEGRPESYHDQDGTLWVHASRIHPQVDVYRRRWRADGREGVYFPGCVLPDRSSLYWGPIEEREPEPGPEPGPEPAARPCGRGVVSAVARFFGL